MSIYTIKRYSQKHKDIWDTFVTTAKNKSFLFYRNFMEYHEDRFEDFSLLVFKNEEIVALLPANCSEKTLFSHQGLSYGGLILTEKVKFRDVFEAFKQLLIFLEKGGFEFLEIKNMPSFYTQFPAEEADYLFFLLEAKLIRVDITSTICYKNRLPIQKNRLEGLKKASNNYLKIVEINDFSAFWEDILIPNLAKNHDAIPVHSLEEIELLAKRFPQNIRQFNVLDPVEKTVAGATVFETENVAHVQYISGNADKQQLGSLDFLFEFLINDVFSKKAYFDFGTSNENGGKNLNSGLHYWKESFGARPFVHRTFSIPIKNHPNLDAVLN